MGRRDDLEDDMRVLIHRHSLRRICFALADYCYGEATQTRDRETAGWTYLGRLFTTAETNVAKLEPPAEGDTNGRS